MLSGVSEEQPSRFELARQVVVNVGAGLAAGYAGPLAGTVAAGAAPVVLAGMDWISATIGERRIGHATETLTDAADEFGAETAEEFAAFIKAALSDEEHQELLARALVIAQDTAMRDKRRALGRALAAAASDTGTKVDAEMLFIRVLADLDEPHIRVLRITSTVPAYQDKYAKEMEAVGEDPVRQWYPSTIEQADPGLDGMAWALLETLERHGLLSSSGEQLTQSGWEPEYTITPYGEWFLTRLAEPE